MNDQDKYTKNTREIHPFKICCLGFLAGVGSKPHKIESKAGKWIILCKYWHIWYPERRGGRIRGCALCWQWELEPCWRTLPWMRRASHCCSVIYKTSSSESSRLYKVVAEGVFPLCSRVKLVLFLFQVPGKELCITVQCKRLRSCPSRVPPQGSLRFCPLAIWSLCALRFGDDVLPVEKRMWCHKRPFGERIVRDLCRS